MIWEEVEDLRENRVWVYAFRWRCVVSAEDCGRVELYCRYC
jgi:hypothetical protein